ncbi:Tetratricopeptide repeat protein 39B [Fasciolopsis buskii]|uniref:Tetratricopeptide repeat protein 39B n=1 Tax=Fasciolopsis buskii TaxID=27845 RepID=A0A8E0S277_9TREM|nr:Tetratricopeptide repeat protein 39B [Fasciolopsis buski]
MFMYPTATPFIQHTAPRGYLRGEDNDRSVFGQQIPGGQITSEKMEHLVAATEHIRATLNACNASRRKAALTETITKQIGKRRIAVFKDYTEEQAHAELCYAEGLLQLAFLSMLQDEKLTTLIRSSLKIRQCYKCYRICWRILKHREWSDGLSKSTFESGVRLGVGAFNMMISLLPKRVLKLLEFVGFSGDRNFGLQQLRIGAGMRESIRAPLCALLLLVYDLYATHMLAFEQPEHVVEAKELLSYWQIIYPKSAIFTLLIGRSEAVAGDLEKLFIVFLRACILFQAIETFEQAIKLPLDWPQYQHICYWELMWCYALRADWMKAVQCAERLACESQWSQASYRYMKAAFLLQWLDDPGVGTPKPTDKTFPTTDFSQYETRGKTIEHIDKLLIEIPKLMQRFAGRSLPLEKIALRKSKRYFAQNKRLTLPALELIFIWNGFKMVQFQQDSVMSFLMICENKINELLQMKEKYETYFDDYCLALLLKGVCLRCRGQQFQASMCYQEILQSKKKLKADTYLLPFCEMELCQLSYDEGDMQQACKHLERALGYKGYSLESRLHFRIHEMETKLNVRTRKKSASGQIKKAGSEVQIPFRPLSDSGSTQSVGQIAQARADSGSDLESTNLKPIFPEFDDEDFDDMDGGFSSEESAEP